MAVPRAVARDLKRTATRIAKIRDSTVAAGAEFAVGEASRIGGTMKGYDLYAVVSKISNRGTTSTATVEGVPSGFWAIKTYGRRNGYTIRGRTGPLDLRSDARSPAAAFGVTMRTATTGDGRWDDVIESVAEHTAGVFVEQLDGALDG